MASKTETIDAIEALAVHCRPPLMSVEQRELWMRDWCNDLTEFPAEAIATACRKWRHSGSTKFPTPGQLIPLIRDSLPNKPGEKVQVWRPLSDAEYANLTVRDKIRHQMILAHEAGSKAGPMFRNTSSGGPISKASGIHLTEAEMPDTWRTWTEIQRRHLAEAKRLREYLKLPAAAE
jgi:hypothetical protein